MRQYGQDVIDAYRGTFGRHLLNLTWFEQPCNDGHPVGEWKHCSISGCVMSFGEDCALLTAGHILKGLDARLASKQATIRSSALFHGSGLNPGTEIPVPFAYVDQVRWFEDNMARGIDIGAIRIPREVRTVCEENGVQCLTAESILDFRVPPFDEYLGIGIPTATHGQREYEENGEYVREGLSQLVVMPIRTVEAPSDTLPTPHERVFFEPKQNLSFEQIDGMSGAPIFGLRKVDGRFKYRLVAMQYAYRADGLIVASPSEVFVAIVRDWLMAG